MAKTALVTGANRGLGLEVCRQLGNSGFELWLGARRAEAGAEAAATLQAEGLSVTPLVLDVADERSVAEVRARAEREGWQLDALVNNAAVSLRGFDAELAAATLATNFYGAVRVADALLFALRDGARLVNVSSGMGQLSAFGPERRAELERVATRARLFEIVQGFLDDVRAGRHAQRGWPSNAYSVSKAALNGFTRLVAAEQPRLKVSSVCPGWVRTELGGSAAPRSVEQGARSIVWAATLGSDGPSGGFFRDGQPIEW